MREGAFFRLRLRVHLIPNGTALHIDDRMMPVLPRWRCSQSVYITGVDLLHDLFEVQCRDMMAFVHDHHSVILHQRTNRITADDGL